MKKLFTSFLALAAVASMSAKVVYVATDGANTNDGTSWNAAVADIQKACQMVEKGDQIWVAGGTYTLSEATLKANNDDKGIWHITIGDGVSLYGGFKKGDTKIEDRERPDASQPYLFANPTVITSNGIVLADRIINSSPKTVDKERSLFDGFTIYNVGCKNYAMIHIGTNTTMQNCIVRKCTATGTNGSAQIVNLCHDCLIKDCLLEDNYFADGVDGLKFNVVRLCAEPKTPKASSAQGLLFRNNGQGTCLHIYNYPEATGTNFITDCSFVDNRTVTCLYINNGKPVNSPVIVDRCLFANNVGTTAAATVGVGVAISGTSGSPAAVANCIVRNNENLAAETADAKNSIVALNSGNVELINCLIHNNTSKHACVFTTGLTLNNTIANNIGTNYAQTKSTGSFFNNLYVGNVATKDKIFLADTESNIEFIGNGVNEADVVISNPNAFADRFVADLTPAIFVAPTATAGVLDAATAAAADFSLVAGSAASNAGIWDYDGMPAYPAMYIGFITDGVFNEDIVKLFKTDIAGNERVVNGQINLGCYQGAKGTGVEAVKAENAAKVYGLNGAVVVENAQAAVEVYSIGGSLVAKAECNGQATVEVPAGLYIVKVGNAAFKAIVK